MDPLVNIHEAIRKKKEEFSFYNRYIEAQIAYVGAKIIQRPRTIVQRYILQIYTSYTAGNLILLLLLLGVCIVVGRVWEADESELLKSPTVAAPTFL